MSDLPSESMNTPTLPKEFRELIIPLIRELIIEQPLDIALFCAHYFERLLDERRRNKEESDELTTCANEPQKKSDAIPKEDLETRQEHILPPTKSFIQGSSSEPALSDESAKIRGDGKALRETTSCQDTGSSVSSHKTRHKTVTFNLDNLIETIQSNTCCVDLCDYEEAESSGSLPQIIDENYQLTEEYTVEYPREIVDDCSDICSSTNIACSDFPCSIGKGNISGGSNDSDSSGYQEDLSDTEPSAPPYEADQSESGSLLNITQQEGSLSTPSSGRKKWTLSEENLHFELKSQSPEPDIEPDDLSDSVEEVKDDSKIKVQPHVSFEFLPHLAKNNVEEDYVVVESDILIPGEDSYETMHPVRSAPMIDENVEYEVSRHDLELHTLIDSLSSVLENIASDFNANTCQLSDNNSPSQSISVQHDTLEGNVSLIELDNDTQESIDAQNRSDLPNCASDLNSGLDDENITHEEINYVSDLSSHNFDNPDFLCNGHLSPDPNDSMDQMNRTNSEHFSNFEKDCFDYMPSLENGYVNEGFRMEQEDTPNTYNNRRANYMRGRRRDLSSFEHLSSRRTHRRTRVHSATRHYQFRDRSEIRDRGDAPFFPHIDETPELSTEEETYYTLEASADDTGSFSSRAPLTEEDDIWKCSNSEGSVSTNDVRDILSKLILGGDAPQRSVEEAPSRIGGSVNDLLSQMRMNLAEFRYGDGKEKSDGCKKDGASHDSKAELLPMSEGDGFQVQRNAAEAGPCPCPCVDMLPPTEDLRLGVIGDGNQDVTRGLDPPVLIRNASNSIVLELNSAGGDHRLETRQNQASPDSTIASTAESSEGDEIPSGLDEEDSGDVNIENMHDVDNGSDVDNELREDNDEEPLDD